MKLTVVGAGNVGAPGSPRRASARCDGPRPARKMPVSFLPRLTRSARRPAAGRLHDVLPDPEQFGRILRVELMRADRGRTGFCLAVFDLGVWHDGPDRDAADGLRAAAFARYLLERLRATDYAGHLGAGRVAVILWHTDEFGAARFVEKVARGWHASKRPPVTVYAYPSQQRVGGGPRMVAARPRGRAARGADRAGSKPGESKRGESKRGASTDPAASEAGDAGTPGGRSESDRRFRDGGDLNGGAGDGLGGLLAAAAGEASPVWKPVPIAGTETVSVCDVSSEVETARDVPVTEELPVAEDDTLEEPTVRDDDDPPPPPPMVPVYALEELLLCPLPRWKRAVDVLGAGAGLILLAPLLAAVAAAVKLTSRGPALFTQTRDGLGGRRFTIYKFRTMVPDAEARKAALRAQSEQDGPAFKMARDPRITPIGRWLRKTCLDELPQLWNVLRGDMSLVGPRPLDSRESDRTSWWERRRLLVTPGLTCIWQVHGKSRVSFDEWMRMDIRYMQGRGAAGDFGLIFRTAWNMARHRGSH